MAALYQSDQDTGRAHDVNMCAIDAGDFSTTNDSDVSCRRQFVGDARCVVSSELVDAYLDLSVTVLDVLNLLSTLTTPTPSCFCVRYAHSDKHHDTKGKVP